MIYTHSSAKKGSNEPLDYKYNLKNKTIHFFNPLLKILKNFRVNSCFLIKHITLKKY